MTIQAAAWAWRLEGLSPLAKLLAIGIANTFHDSGTQPMSLDRLLKFTGADPVDIDLAFEELGRFGVEYSFDGDFVKVDLPLPTLGRVDPPTLQPAHWIYVVSSPAAIKVGISRDAQQRFRTLQWTIPQPLRLEWTASGPRGLISMVETEVHTLLLGNRINGEWFYVSSRTAIDAIRIQLARHGLPAPK